MMKYLVSAIVLCLCFCSSSAQKKIFKEEHYFVKDGAIDNDCITERRTFKYNQKGEFVSGEKRIKGGKNYPLESYEDRYNSLLDIDRRNSYYLKDKDERIVMQRYYSGDTVFVHHYTYNKWGDLIKDKLAIKIGALQSTTEYTYEYFYLSKFTYATNEEGVTAISGYVDDYKSEWLKRTVRKDGKIVQHINRRISSPSNNEFSFSSWLNQ